MKWGLIARADDRGLGNMTWEMHRNLHPDRTLVVELGAIARGFVQHTGRYPDATVVRWEGGQLPEAEVRDWLAGLDVVYSAETFYDWQVCRWADEAGVATVLHVMPEFHRHHVPGHGLPEPTAWWAPTPWRMEHLPPGTRLVPVPVALDRHQWATPARPDGAPLRVLHVAGHRAAGDRNGTNLLLQALRMVRQPMQVTITSQDARLPSFRPPRHVALRTVPKGTADYWGLYPGYDVLALPRRYGGLCLPAQEAMAAGLALVLPACEPNAWWPARLVAADPHAHLVCAAGDLPTWKARPTDLAATLDHLATDGDVLAALQLCARVWALAHSWPALADLYRAELLAACT